MLTKLTQTALVVLYDIDCKTFFSCPDSYGLPAAGLAELLAQLEQGGLIALPADGFPTDRSPYVLTRPVTHISLLDVLEATGEHLNCNHTAYEDFYARHGVVARKLGVINQVTRTCLSEINISEISVTLLRQ